MLLQKIFRKVKLYKQLELDIWGLHLIYCDKRKLVTKIMYSLYLERKEFLEKKKMRYIYRVDLDKPQRKKKYFKWKFLTRKLVRLFYLTLSYSKFRKLLESAFKHDGSYESNYILLIENRVIFMLYRLQFMLNVFNLKIFILNNGVYIDNRLIKYCDKAVKFGSVLTVSRYWSNRFKYLILVRMSKNQYYFSIPRYLFVNYKLMFGFVYREPKIRDIVYPIRQIDIYRGADIL